jgi:hypothetical protein
MAVKEAGPSWSYVDDGSEEHVQLLIERLKASHAEELRVLLAMKRSAHALRIHARPITAARELERYEEAESIARTLADAESIEELIAVRARARAWRRP